MKKKELKEILQFSIDHLQKYIDSMENLEEEAEDVKEVITKSIRKAMFDKLISKKGENGTAD